MGYFSLLSIFLSDRQMDAPLGSGARGTPTMSSRVIVLAFVALLWTMPVRGAESGVCYDCLCRIKELGFYVDLPEGYDCTPPPPPSPPSPPSPPPYTGPPLAMISWDFAWNSGDLSDRAQHCVDKTLTHHPYDMGAYTSRNLVIGVTCCYNEVDVTSDNVHRPECYDATSPWDYDAAAAMCASYNSVICTVEQLRAGYDLAKGCGFDDKYNWARDAC